MFQVKLFYKNTPSDSGDLTTSIIERIKEGDLTLKDKFINDHLNYISKTVSNLLGKCIDSKNSEELSIGLMAFNEAIEFFDPERNKNFYKYSNMIINHRIIDYIRKNKKHNNVLPFSYLEQNNTFNPEYLISDSHSQYEKIEVKEELISFQHQLMDFGFTLKELVLSSPKHKDSRLLSIRIARVIANNEEIYCKMIKKKRIPLTELLKLIKVNRKTITRNRVFIVAVCLILRSNLENLKEFINGVEEVGEKYE